MRNRISNSRMAEAVTGDTEAQKEILAEIDRLEMLLPAPPRRLSIWPWIIVAWFAMNIIFPISATVSH
jgi:hypothetical protein